MTIAVARVRLPARRSSRWISALVGIMVWSVLSICRDAKASHADQPTTQTQIALTGKLSFNEHVQPILSEYCYHCHGPDSGSRKAELRLDRAEFAYAPHDKSGPAIIPGNPEKSPLVRRIESKDEKEIMPPPEAHKTLTPEQIALLRQWIAEGAEYQEHWSFLAPQRRAPPAPAATSPHAQWTVNPIDAFILARLSQEKLTPSPEADRRTLIRRVTFDLTGLAPTPEEVNAFVNDPESDAYERLVDRLLASPRYGEHRARYWLDYVRYADTHGLHYDNYRSIWPYRDYLIRAFNANKPFDRLIKEQLAGDLLPARTLDEWIATGFVRSNVTTNEGGTVPEEVAINQTRDRIEAFGATFLGLTTGCAACHDHKFDPITQKDYYTLSAFLNNTLEKPWDSNEPAPPPVIHLPKDENRAAMEAAIAQRGELQARLDARHRRVTELVRAWLASGQRPRPVSTDRLELRLRLDENGGNVVKNSAPHARVPTHQAETNPLIWGETTWFWPTMRMDIFTRLPLGSIGDVEVHEPFSGGGWLLLRNKPGLGGKGTGDGSLFARMGDFRRHGGRGWEIYHDDLRFVVNIVQSAQTGGLPGLAPITDTIDSARITRPLHRISPRLARKKLPVPQAIQVATKNTFKRDTWVHVFFTYDGSQTAAGVKIYINGQPVETVTKRDSLVPGETIRTDAVTHLGRRDDFMPMRETRFQDVRFYRRALGTEEVVRLAYEDVAAEIIAREPDPRRWTSDESFVVVDRFFLGEIDLEAKRLAAEIAVLDGEIDRLGQGGVPTLIARERTTRAYADILKRGDYFNREARVGPATPHFLPPLPTGSPPNRLGLAEWLVAPEHPLTARVAVNRMWQEVFGRGLVETAGDFGIMGARPSHEALLDWLAVEFRTSGWDVKRLYRLLVLSATYRQSEVVPPEALAQDPANRLFARGPRFRLDGEMIRDAALQVSGLLVEKIGGPSVKPYQPPRIWEEVAIGGSNTSKYKADQGEGLYRRSVYTFWKRSSPPVSLEAFDATSREVVCTRRARSNTPLQAFVTMNDPQFVEAARKLAERVIRAAATEEARFDWLAQLTLNRSLKAAEKAILTKACARYRAHFRAQPDDAPALLSVGESPVDQTLDSTELAEWTLVSSQFFNLDEFLTK